MVQRLFAGFLQQRPRIDPKPVHIRYVVNTVTILVSLSLSFYRCFAVFLVYMLVLRERRMGKLWNPPVSNAFLETMDSKGNSYHLTF